MEPFRIHVAAEVLDDLRVRLRHTRWPDQLPDIGPPLACPPRAPTAFGAGGHRGEIGSAAAWKIASGIQRRRFGRSVCGLCVCHG